MLHIEENPKLIERLASRVAHEVKNRLAIVLQGIDYFSAGITPGNDSASAVLEDMKEAVGRADRMIHRLLDVSRPPRPNLRPEDLNSIIESALLMAKPETHGIRVIRDFTPLPRLWLDKSKMEQAFLNLFLNAVEAMPDGGELRISSCRKKTGREKPVVVATIENTGQIPKEILREIFEPFVTTKASLGHLGLGLPIVKNIIAAHNGEIKAASGNGVVRLTLVFKEVAGNSPGGRFKLSDRPGLPRDDRQQHAQSQKLP